jgi:hypothetical protein
MTINEEDIILAALKIETPQFSQDANSIAVMNPI